jgi:hypothetical protein
LPGRASGSIPGQLHRKGPQAVIVGPGNTFTPKQIQLDTASGKVYWRDREGMRVMRANLNGSQIETLIQTGHGDTDRRDQRNWCVGVAVDAAASTHGLSDRRDSSIADPTP